MMLDENRWNGLIGTIYDAPLRQQSWQDAISELSVDP